MTVIFHINFIVIIINGTVTEAKKLSFIISDNSTPTKGYFESEKVLHHVEKKI